MASVALRKADLPVLTRVGSLGVSIRANGQISFSSMASKTLNPAVNKFYAPLWDAKTRTLTIKALSTATPKEKSLAEAAIGKISVGKKSGGVFIAASPILQYIGYDYRASGNQPLKATEDVEGASVSFVVPKGAVTPLPVKPRVSKLATVPNGTSKAAAAAAEPEEDEDAEEVEDDEDDEEEEEE